MVGVGLGGVFGGAIILPGICISGGADGGGGKAFVRLNKFNFPIRPSNVFGKDWSGDGVALNFWDWSSSAGTTVSAGNFGRRDWLGATFGTIGPPGAAVLSPLCTTG
jgi:hypothetical protein